jgi:hypothetical protein
MVDILTVDILTFNILTVNILTVDILMVNILTVNNVTFRHFDSQQCDISAFWQSTMWHFGILTVNNVTFWHFDGRQVGQWHVGSLHRNVASNYVGRYLWGIDFRPSYRPLPATRMRKLDLGPFTCQEDVDQGDQIGQILGQIFGRIFVFTLCSYLKIIQLAHIFGLLFSTAKVMH